MFADLNEADEDSEMFPWRQPIYQYPLSQTQLASRSSARRNG